MKAVSPWMNFAYEGRRVRTVIILGVVWFVAVDVCRVLGFKNARDAVANHLDDDEVTTVSDILRNFSLDTDGSVGIPDTSLLRGGSSRNLVSFSGLLALTLISAKAEARPFRRWVTHDVLPSIFKRGFYVLTPPVSATKARLGARALLQAAHEKRQDVGGQLSEQQIRKELARRVLEEHPEWIEPGIGQWLHDSVYHAWLREEREAARRHDSAQGELFPTYVVMRAGRERAVERPALTRAEKMDLLRRGYRGRTGLRKWDDRLLAHDRALVCEHNREWPETAFTEAELLMIAPDLADLGRENTPTQGTGE